MSFSHPLLSFLSCSFELLLFPLLILHFHFSFSYFLLVSHAIENAELTIPNIPPEAVIRDALDCFVELFEGEGVVLLPDIPSGISSLDIISAQQQLGRDSQYHHGMPNSSYSILNSHTHHVISDSNYNTQHSHAHHDMSGSNGK